MKTIIVLCITAILLVTISTSSFAKCLFKGRSPHPSIFESSVMFSALYYATDDSNCTIDFSSDINITRTDQEVLVFALGIACVKGSSHIALVNSKNIIRKDIISYLQLIGQCKIDLHDIATFSNASDFKVLNIVRGAKLVISNTDSPQYHYDLKSLSSIGTLTMESGAKSGIPNIFLHSKWTQVAEVKFVDYGVKTFPSELKNSMPHLQDLDLDKNSLTQPPDFPWEDASFVLPRNLTRKSVFNEHYQERAVVQRNLYRRFLSLEFNKIQNLSSYLFKGFLQKLSLKGNGLHTIGENCFANLFGINVLDLSHNQLTVLSTGLFRAFDKLLDLRLDWNNITDIPADIFSKCKKLKLLHLNNNHIRNIPKNMLKDHDELIEIHLENNYIKRVFYGGLPDNSNKLKQLFLQNNQLESIPDSVFCARSLTKIFMANNRVTFRGLVQALDSFELNTFKYCLAESASSLTYELRKTSTYMDLTNNNITTMNISKMNNEQRHKLVMMLVVFELDLKNNPLQCDCTMLEIKQMLAEINTNYSNTKTRFNSWVCSGPRELKEKRLVSIADRSLLCSYKGLDCPTNCTCSIRGVNNSYVIDGRQKGFKTLPLSMPTGKDLEIYLENNLIEELSTSRNYLRNVTILHLSSNKIKYINDSFITQLTSLRELKLDSNDLKRLPQNIQMLTSRTSFVSLSIYHNYLLCDCHAKWLKPWIHNASNKLQHIQNIKCTSDKKESRPIIDVPLSDFTCETTKNQVILKKEEHIIGLIILGIILVIIIMVFILVYYFRGEMKVLMYTHFNWHPFDRVDDQEPCKIYDVFISYSSHDTEWVNLQLKDKLESYEPPYRICLHDRDFEVGATIMENILNSVEKSKRMIIVLSNSFLESEWCRYEFRAAHRRVLADRTNYLIMILFDDVNTNDLDDEMKLYLRTNTYLSVSNKWFWQKLLYALPKPRKQDAEKIDDIEMATQK